MRHFWVYQTPLMKKSLIALSNVASQYPYTGTFDGLLHLDSSEARNYMVDVAGMTILLFPSGLVLTW